MHVYLDDTKLADAPSAEEAIDLARDAIKDSDRIIIDINADGAPAPDAIFEGDTQGLEFSELRFVTAKTSAFLTETAHAAKDSLELIRADQKAAAERLRTGEMEDAMQTLQGVMEGWQAVRDVVDQVAQLASIDLGSLQAGDTKGDELIASLGASLTEVRDTLKGEDWASLGDAVEYDLDELAAKWSTLLDALIARAEG
jgi:hypothetical protein